MANLVDFTPAALTPSLLEEDGMEDYEDIKKQLFINEPETPLRPPPSQKEPVLIYLRLRPKSQSEITNRDHDCLHPVNEHELVVVAPKNSKQYKNTRYNTENTQKFTFSRIFHPETTQKELFDETLRPLLTDFIEGQNCLVFTYGVTNSGKSYTVTGTSSDPGLLPRTLDAIFNSLDPQLHLSDMKILPQRFSEVCYLSDEEMEVEQQRKDHVMKLVKEVGSRTITPILEEEEPDDLMELSEEQDISSISTISKASSNASSLTDIDGVSFDEFQICDDSSLDLKSLENKKCAIFVSFAEIYNEFIYDLLVDTPVRGKSRPSLKISQDKHKNYYIKGLHEIQVTDVDEAMLTLRLGLKHRHVASTRLNQQSSRSHSIYTIKLVRLANVKNPVNAIVNRISIVDLAGAERSAKTGTSGVRVKEAGNINTSLLTLGKCIDAMKHNQSKRSNEDRIVPFRESKLTRLFQNYFIGKGEGLRHGKISMFVNVSNTASVFDETYHVLKFSALTSKIVPVTKSIESQMPFTSSTCPPCTPSFKHATPCAFNNATPYHKGTAQHSKCLNCKALEDKLSQYMVANKNEIAQFRVKLLEQECLIRREVSQEFAEQFTEIEDRHDSELREQAEEYEDSYRRRRIELVKSVKKQQSRKRRRCDRDEEGEDEGNQESKMAAFKERIDELEKELAMERKRASAELHDASETYETRVVKLNQQLIDMSLLKNTMQDEFESKLRKKAESCDQMAEKMNQEKADLLNELEELRTIVEEGSERKAGLAEPKVEELLAEKEKWEAERLHFNSQIKELQNGRCREILLEAESRPPTPTSIRSVTPWHEERSSLTIRISQLQQENSEILSRLEGEKARLVERVDELENELEDGRAENEILQARISELITENSEGNGYKPSPLLISLREKARTPSSQVKILPLREELEKAKQALDAAKEARDAEVASSQAMILSLREELDKAGETLDTEIASSQAKKEDSDSEISRLRDELKKVQHANSTLENEMRQMRETITHTLKEYEVTVKNQGQRISELEAETKTLYSLNQELEERNGEWEIKLTRANSAKDSLNLKVIQLSDQLEDSRKAASRRESALMDTSEQCKSMLEEQIASLHKQMAVLQHDLSSCREDLKDTQQELRKKEEELLSLVKTVNEENSVGIQLTSALEEAQKSMEALKGQHQLECAQLSIKARELTQQYEAVIDAKALAHREEVENLKASQLATMQVLKLKQGYQEDLKVEFNVQRKEIASLTNDMKQAEKKLSKAKSLESDLKDQKKLCCQLQKQLLASSEENKILQEKIITLEKKEDEEHIYEEPPNLSSASNKTIYDTVLDDTLSLTQIHSSTLVDKCNASTRSLSTSGGGDEGDGRYVHVLERSSQLMEDTLVESGEKLEIDATPKPLRKNARKRKKRDLDENNHESKASVTTVIKNIKYGLRNRNKTPLTPLRQSDDSDFTPNSIKRFKNKSTGGKYTYKKSLTRTPESPEAKSTIATRTRTRLRKDQISAPLSLVASPMMQARTRGALVLGSRLATET